MICGKQKCGEYNMLVCVRDRAHDGVCNYVVDHENDYPQNKPRVRLPLAVLPNKRVACCCTPTTCTCKKPVDKKRGSGKVVSK